VSIKAHPSFATVTTDVVDGLKETFTQRDDDTSESFRVNVRFEEEVDVIGTDRIVAVPWTYSCRHTGDFHGLFRTGRELTIEGVTLVDYRSGELLLHRFVDWAGVIAQLGLEVSGRIPVTEDEYEFGRSETS
jgi:hypothetical protein